VGVGDGRPAARSGEGMGLLPTVTGKPGSVVVAVGDDRLYTFDAEGRLFSALVGGHTFRRGLDNRVLEKWSGPRHPGAAPWQGRRRRWLSRDEALAFLDGIYGDLRRVRTRVRAERGPGDGGSGWWDRALAWDAAGLEADGRRFREVYEPVGILPPDQYLSVVVQATVGCSYNRCTFCDFYRGQAFRIKSPAEFREHLKGVRAFFGAALAGRRWLFCGEGNALAVPAGPLAELLRAAGEAFPVAPAELDGPGLSRWLADRPVGFAGFAGFLDAIGGTRQPVEDLAVLRSLGLRRAYVGLETGHQGSRAPGSTCGERWRPCGRRGSRRRSSSCWGWGAGSSPPGTCGTRSASWRRWAWERPTWSTCRRSWTARGRSTGRGQPRPASSR
jgi:hypothetical protein